MPSSLALSVNGISIDALISAATSVSPRVMSVPQPVFYTLYVQPAPACATASTAAVSLTLMTAGIPITVSVTVRDSFGNLRSRNSYSSVSNMDNVVALLYPLPSPPTPAQNFLNGYVPSGINYIMQQKKMQHSSAQRAPRLNAATYACEQDLLRAAAAPLTSVPRSRILSSEMR